MLQSNYLNTYSMNWILQSKLRPRVQLQQQQQYYHGRDYQRCPRGANRVVPLCCLDDVLWDTQCSKMRKAVQYKYVQYVESYNLQPQILIQSIFPLSLLVCFKHSKQCSIISPSEITLFCPLLSLFGTPLDSHQQQLIQGTYARNTGSHFPSDMRP